MLSLYESYTYLGLELVASLKWKIEKDITMNKQKKKQRKCLVKASPTTIRQEIKFLNAIIKPRIFNTYYGLPFAKPNIWEIDKTLRGAFTVEVPLLRQRT